MCIHSLYWRLQLSSKLTLPAFFSFFFQKIRNAGSLLPLFSQYFAFFYPKLFAHSFSFSFVLYYTFFIFTVLEELLNQYLMGGKEPSRRDLDHVFLRFGRKDLQFSFFGIKLWFYFYFIFYSFQFFYAIFVFFLCFLFLFVVFFSDFFFYFVLKDWCWVVIPFEKK